MVKYLFIAFICSAGITTKHGYRETFTGSAIMDIKNGYLYIGDKRPFRINGESGDTLCISDMGTMGIMWNSGDTINLKLSWMKEHEYWSYLTCGRSLSK